MKRRSAPLPLLSRAPRSATEIGINTYILQDREPVRCLDYELWEGWIDYPDNRCVVGRTEFHHDGTLVSTTFIGIDLAPVASLGPLLFETIVTGGELNGYRGLHKTWREAQAAHDEACHLVRETLT